MHAHVTPLLRCRGKYGSTGKNWEDPSSTLPHPCPWTSWQINLDAPFDCWRRGSALETRIKPPPQAQTVRGKWLQLPPPLPCPLCSDVDGIYGNGIRRAPSGLPPRRTASGWPAGRRAARRQSAAGRARRQRGGIFSKESACRWVGGSLWR